MAWKGKRQAIPKTIVGVLRKRMKYLGWKEEDEWHWKLEREEEEGESWDINLRNIKERTEEEWKKERGRIMHLVRANFRRKSFMKFLDVKTRRFYINIDKRRYPEDRINAVRKVKGDGVTMAILVGAVMSPACFMDGKMQAKTGLPTGCPCGCKEVGYHDYVYWECPGMEKAIMGTNRDLRPRPKPVDEWQRRFGWPTGSQKDKRRDDLILEWMWATTMYIWGDRYKSAEEAAKIQKVQERRRI
jgi:hypothetical protein